MGNINTMLSLDGEANFRRQLNLINTNLKTLEKELTATSSEFAKGAQKMQQNAQIQTNLTRQTEALTSKQNILKNAVMSASNQVAESRNKLTQAQQKYLDITTTVNKYKDTIAKLKDKYGENNSAVKILENSLKQLETQQKSASKEVASAEKKLDAATKQYHKYKQELADTETALNKVASAQRKSNEALGNGKSKVDIARTAFKLFGDTLTMVPINLSSVSDAMNKVANAGFKTMELSLKSVTSEINLGVSGLEAYVKGLAAAGTAVVGFAANTGMSFEAEMSKVQAYSGIGNDEEGQKQMAALTEAAKEQGAKTTKTATEAASALAYLSLNGYKTAEMLDVLEPVVKASEAGTMDLATVANLTARSLTSYGKSASDAEDFLNTLVAAQNNSSTSLYDLLTAYADMAGTFKSLNIDMTESATILGVFANQGKTGAEAATALSSVMLRLVGSNKKASQALESIGVTAWNDDGTFRGLTTVLKDLGTALEGATQEEETLIEAQIGGVMRVQELKKLIAGVNNEEEYNKVFEPISRAIEDQTLYTTAATMMDNLKGKVELLKSAISGLGLSIYETFGDQATTSVETMSGWVNILDEGVKGGSTASVIDSIKAVSSRMSTELTKISEKTAEELPAKLRIYNTVITQIFKLMLQALHENKDVILPELIQGLTDLVLEIIKYLPQLTEDVASGAEILFSGILEGMQKSADKLVDDGILDSMVQSICDFFSNNTEPLLGAGLTILETLGTGITNNLDEILTTAMDVLTRLATDIAENAPEALESIGSVVGTIVDVITEGDNLEKLVDAAVDIINSLGTYIGENSDNIIDGCTELIERITTELTTETNKEKMYEAGRELGKTVLKGLAAALIGLQKNTWTSWASMITGGSWWDDLSEYVTGQSRIEWLDDIMRSDTVSSATSTNTSTNNTEWIGAVHVDMSGSTINGYNDIESLIDDTSEAIKNKTMGGGR